MSGYQLWSPRTTFERTYEAQRYMEEETRNGEDSVSAAALGSLAHYKGIWSEPVLPSPIMYDSARKASNPSHHTFPHSSPMARLPHLDSSSNSKGSRGLVKKRPRQEYGWDSSVEPKKYGSPYRDRCRGGAEEVDPQSLQPRSAEKCGVSSDRTFVDNAGSSDRRIIDNAGTRTVRDGRLGLTLDRLWIEDDNDAFVAAQSLLKMHSGDSTKSDQGSGVAVGHDSSPEAPSIMSQPLSHAQYSAYNMVDQGRSAGAQGYRGFSDRVEETGAVESPSTTAAFDAQGCRGFSGRREGIGAVESPTPTASFDFGLSSQKGAYAHEAVASNRRLPEGVRDGEAVELSKRQSSGYGVASVSNHPAPRSHIDTPWGVGGAASKKADSSDEIDPQLWTRVDFKEKCLAPFCTIRDATTHFSVRRHYHARCSHVHLNGEKKGMPFHHYQLEKVRKHQRVHKRIDSAPPIHTKVDELTEAGIEVHEPSLWSDGSTRSLSGLVQQQCALTGKPDWNACSAECSRSGVVRSPIQCLLHWRIVVNSGSIIPSQDKTWSAVEDERLHLVTNLYNANFKKVATAMPGRDLRQCKSRFADVVDPSRRTIPPEWTDGQDTHLLSLVRKYGGKVGDIVKDLPGRSYADVKERTRLLRVRTKSLGTGPPRVRVKPDTPSSTPTSSPALPTSHLINGIGISPLPSSNPQFFASANVVSESSQNSIVSGDVVMSSADSSPQASMSQFYGKIKPRMQGKHLVYRAPLSTAGAEESHIPVRFREEPINTGLGSDSSSDGGEEG